MEKEHVINEHLPPASPTTEKKPFKIRAAMNELKVVAPAHQIAVANDTTMNQKNIGERP